MRIRVADDDSVIRRLEALLKEQGQGVVACEDGEHSDSVIGLHECCFDCDRMNLLGRVFINGG